MLGLLGGHEGLGFGAGLAFGDGDDDSTDDDGDCGWLVGCCCARTCFIGDGDNDNKEEDNDNGPDMIRKTERETRTTSDITRLRLLIVILLSLPSFKCQAPPPLLDNACFISCSKLGIGCAPTICV